MEHNEVHKIVICLGSSCYSRGNNEVLDQIKLYLTEHHLEGTVEFMGDLCSHRCHNGPILVIDDRVFEQVSVARIREILNDVFAIT